LSIKAAGVEMSTDTAARKRVPLMLLKGARKTGLTRVTSGLRVLPDYLVIGSQRCGTSSLYRYLLEHPAALQALPKEVHFFDRNENYCRGEAWYKSHFPTAASQAVVQRRTGVRPATGETTPNYLFHPRVPRRVADMLPDVKLIALLRNPVDRAHSSYWHRVAQGFEPLRTFEEALEAEAERTRGELDRMAADESYDSVSLRRYAYVSNGLYADQLERWLRYFPPERLLIIRSEDLFEDAAATVRTVCRFLGLPELRLRRYKVYNTLTSRTLDPATRRRLAEFYRPHNQRLYELIGRNLGWDDGPD
jgi:hypothetical protein